MEKSDIVTNTHKLRGNLYLILMPLVLGFLGIILLTTSFVLPIESIRRNVEHSLSIFEKETDYFSLMPSIDGSSFDNYTDAIYLNEAIVGSDNAGILECALSGFSFFCEDDLMPTQRLIRYFNVDNHMIIRNNEKRFFNGYVVALKVLLELTDYSGIRRFNIILELILLFFLCYLMKKRCLDKFIPPLLISLLMLKPVTMALCMAFSGFYYCSVIPCIIMLCFNEKLKIGNRYVLFFECIGCCTYYFNMNYLQLLTFAIPMLFFFLLNGFHEKATSMLVQSVYMFATWGFGYYCMMLVKWAAYAVVLNEPSIFKEMLNTFLMRTSNGVGSQMITRTDALERNISTFLSDRWWLLVEMTFILYNLIMIRKNQKRKKITEGMLLWLLVMMLIPLIRYLIFANHVYIHHWVMYRLLVIPVLAINIILVYIRTPQTEDSKR